MFPMKKSEMMAMIWTMKNIHFFIWGKVRINYKIWLVCFRFTTTSWVPLLPFNFNSQQIKKNQKKKNLFFSRGQLKGCYFFFFFFCVRCVWCSGLRENVLFICTWGDTTLYTRVTTFFSIYFFRLCSCGHSCWIIPVL